MDMSLTQVKPVALGALNPGVVVYAHVPFDQGDGEKSRPAVVVGRRGRDILLKSITSSGRAQNYPGLYDPIRDLEPAGLDRLSWARKSPVTVDRIEIIEIIGHLSENDEAILR